MPTCKHCGLEAQTERGLSRHINSKHGEGSPAATRDGLTAGGPLLPACEGQHTYQSGHDEYHVKLCLSCGDTVMRSAGECGPTCSIVAARDEARKRGIRPEELRAREHAVARLATVRSSFHALLKVLDMTELPKEADVLIDRINTHLKTWKPDAKDGS